MNRPGRLAHFLRLANRMPGQSGRLIEIRRHQLGQGQQPLVQSRLRAWLQQRRAAARDHHRVDHQLQPAPLGQALGHRIDDRPRKQHPGFHRTHRQAGKHGIQLRLDHTRLGRLDRRDLTRSLCRDTRHHTRPMHPQRIENPQVRLHASPTTAVGPCNR